MYLQTTDIIRNVMKLLKKINTKIANHMFVYMDVHFFEVSILTLMFVSVIHKWIILFDKCENL